MNLNGLHRAELPMLCAGALQSKISVWILLRRVVSGLINNIIIIIKTHIPTHIPYTINDGPGFRPWSFLRKEDASSLELQGCRLPQENEANNN